MKMTRMQTRRDAEERAARDATAAFKPRARWSLHSGGGGRQSMTDQALEVMGARVSAQSAGSEDFA